MQQLFFKIGLAIFLLTGASAAALLLTHAEPAGAIPALVVLGIASAATLLYVYATLQPIKALTEELEALGRGRVSGRALPVGPDELGRQAQAINQARAHLGALSAQLEELAAGALKVDQVEARVLASQRLADADLPVRPSHGELERPMLVLHNHLRRLTLQARLLAHDQLHHPALDERVPGELGDALWAVLVSLRELSARATQIARGDLTSLDAGQGDLKGAFNMTVLSLRTIIDEIVQTTLHITTSAEEILMVLREQELAASHQASGVEETQRTMETLLSSAKKIAESAQTVFKSAERTQANNRLIADRANELKSHTERIGEILESIKNIADRSDLLALNASLEGLRAGEAGKGFTLVANEMRRLAENIKESVGDVKELLSNIRESALSSVMAIEEGSHLSQRTTESALKISLITQQQQSGTEQVTQSMEELSHLINQGLVGTRQVTTAASELAQLSENVRQLMRSYDTSGTGAARPSQGSYPRPHVSTGQLRASREAAAGRLAQAKQSQPGSRRSPGREDQPTPTASSSGAGQIQALARKSAAASPAASSSSVSSASSSTSSQVPADSEVSRPITQPRLKRPSPELNATMRFVVGDELSDGDAMTLDMSKLHPRRALSSAPSAAASASTSLTSPASYDEDLDGLFDEHSRGVPLRSRADESMEETFDAIERQLESPAALDSDPEGDDPKASRD